MKTCFITIGDWSHDGHNVYDIFRYQTRASIPDQRTALDAAQEKTGLRFTTHSDRDDINSVCREYKDGEITPFHMEMMRRHYRIDCTKFGDEGPGGFAPRRRLFAELVLWLIQCELPAFTHSDLQSFKKHREIDDNPLFPKNGHETVLNGWWSEYNHSLGYGLYCVDRWQGLWKKDALAREPEGKYFRVGKRNAGLLQGMMHELRYPSFHPVAHRDETAETLKRIKDWVNENCRGLVGRAYNRFFFENEHDAVIFKMISGLPTA